MLERMLDMSSLFRRRNRPIKSFSTYILRQLTLYIVVGFISIFILTFLGSVVQTKMDVSPSALKKWTTHISTDTLISALSMEIPQLQTYNKSVGIDTPKASSVIFEMVTSFNPEDPRSLIRSELPGFAFFDGEIIVAGQGVNYTDFPMESAPPIEIVLGDREATLKDPASNGSASQESLPEPNKEPTITTQGKNVVFIYHTHNTESWLPHIPSAKIPDEAYHPKVNITLVGQRLGEELEKRGIGAYVDTTNIVQQLHDAKLDYNQAYKKSGEVVQEVLAQEKEVTFLFDLHRDGHGRAKTTTEINGKSYARTFFVIGGRNENYEKNLAFAEKFHAMLEKVYPGLSKGVLVKNDGNGEYNQSLSEKNIVIEIGGVENTLKESYRTTEALADVIADLYWDAEKVDAKPQQRES
jgi:stage II sporulation protein P